MRLQISTRMVAGILGALALGTGSLLYTQAPSQASGDDEIGIDAVNTAVAEAAACMDDAGVESSIFAAEGLRRAQVTYSVSGTGDNATGPPDATQMAVAQDCLAVHANPVVEEYEEGQGTPSPEQVDNLITMLEECVDAGGKPGTVLPVHLWFGYYPESTRTIELEHEELQAFSECAVHIEATTGLRAPEPVFS